MKNSRKNSIKSISEQGSAYYFPKLKKTDSVLISKDISLPSIDLKKKTASKKKFIEVPDLVSMECSKRHSRSLAMLSKKSEL